MNISEENPHSALIDRLHPVKIRLKSKKLLTPSPSTKTTYHLVLDIGHSGIRFKVGDSIGIYAENDPILVEHLMNALGANPHEIIQDPRSGNSMTLQEFFTRKANLSRLTSSFLKLYYEHEAAHDRKNALGHLLQKDNKVQLSQYLNSHDPLDLFREYQDVKIPMQEICAQFSPLLPRFYSVASSQNHIQNEVHLTVALFTYDHNGTPRFGVGSHFLCHLAQPLVTEMYAYVQPSPHFSLPQDHNAPIIMIGPGTGVAPFRAFMQERLQAQANGKSWLFFGERNRETDFFYEEEWEELVQKNLLKLDVAFSRDQAEKIYVQDRMYANAQELWRWLENGAYFFVCGDARRMAKDVEAMLIRIAEEQGNLSSEEAKAYLKTMRTEKRYLADVY